MKNVPDICIKVTAESFIRFAEKRSVIRFHNKNQLPYKRVQVDGCALTQGQRCDHLLCSADEQEERFVELKGSDVPHAIEQLKATIIQLGEHADNRHSYVVCTKVAPQITTRIQRAKVEFQKVFRSELQVKVTPLDVML